MLALPLRHPISILPASITSQADRVVWLLALGYFACYAVYAGLVKHAASATGESAGVILLPSVVLGTASALVLDHMPRRGEHSSSLHQGYRHRRRRDRRHHGHNDARIHIPRRVDRIRAPPPARRRLNARAARRHDMWPRGSRFLLVGVASQRLRHRYCLSAHRRHTHDCHRLTQYDCLSCRLRGPSAAHDTLREGAGQVGYPKLAYRRGDDRSCCSAPSSGSRAAEHRVSQAHACEPVFPI